MRVRRSIAILLVGIFLAAPLSGCFGNEDEPSLENSIAVSPPTLIAGEFQGMTISAERDLSVFIPYLLKNDVSGLVQNSTIIDLKGGESMQIQVLAPPRADFGLVMVGKFGRSNWPIRAMNESWQTWVEEGWNDVPSPFAIERVEAINQSVLNTVNTSSKDGGGVTIIPLAIHRPISSGYGVEEGGAYATGFVNGRTTYNFLHEITDTTTDPTDLADGARGYLDRWAGQGNVAYEDGALWLKSELESFGLEVMTHRFQFNDILGNQNPEAYNICGYRWGTEFPDEWLVFGAHFDIAPPANAVLLDPHVTGSRTYGTRVGAYDNTAGTSMVLTVAKSMADFDTRRTMVFCLWSGEEGGKRGSDYWTEEYVAEDNPDVVVTNYVNLDMAGVNWPGGGGAPHNDPDPTIDDDGYPKDEEVWPMRIYIGPSEDFNVMNQPGMSGLAMWIGSDAMGVEDQLSILVGGDEHSEDTWKVEAWLDADRPEIIVYEDTTARSDHDSFQTNLGTITLGFGGLVDGYWCYHQTCDTLEEMEDWMDTTGKEYGEENTGTANLVNSLDMISWWATYSFFHLDEKPVLNVYLE
ncbi:MAG: hypothetical protein CXT67_04150 [Methanobacteriota archaeon]|jgi:hypothetical protein|nr:MAG: hypothetical protein CXT67_04150 [Euryarchaeota archaeon]HIK78048.1 M20/M25/M40 family metallo-hydrolase [Candidatus Poseidoniales archaeon]